MVRWEYLTKPRETSGLDPEAVHVVSRSGTATVEDESVTLEPGALLLIEPGETHEITNTGSAPLETVNVYAPPDY